MKAVKLLLFSGLLMVASVVSADEIVLKTQRDKEQYGIGVSVVRNFRQQGMDVDPELIMKGMRDAFVGGKLLLSDDELRDIMQAYTNELRVKQATARRKEAVINRKEGDAFLAANRKKEGVVALPDGLQYKILCPGEGRVPTDTDTVAVNYRGEFLNGKEFDRSPSGKPAFLAMGNVIAGWREALKRMPVGSQWRLFIPPHLAYGEQGTGGDIGPNAVLIFDVELVGIR